MKGMGRKKVEFDTTDIELSRHRAPWIQRISASRHGMAATANYNATAVASKILQKGGNAIDAAVAAAFALGVCEPAASGLGGQTMILYHEAREGKTIALDGSSRAPHRVEPGELPKKDLLRGHCASTVPSTPAVLTYALNTYGSFDLDTILSPAVSLAENGYKITELQHALTRRELKHLKAGSAARFFLKNNRPYQVGAVFKQPVLANTLKVIAQNGVEEFYQGSIAQIIHDDMIKHNGFIRDDDLAQIPWPIERKPLSCRFKGSRVFTFGEPGAGRTLIQMLKVVSHFPKTILNPETPEGVMNLCEIIRRANVDRRDRPFDPNFYPQIQGKKMLTSENAKSIAMQIKTKFKGNGETTHLSVMDKYGNVVALTQSIERVYGSFEAAPELGFLYNNYMSAFEYTDMNHPNYLRPAAVPWASVSPTILMKNKKPFLAIGSPGSERITSAILQVLLHRPRTFRSSSLAAFSVTAVGPSATCGG